ncbi:MAG: Rpn family recombination-promoting nuclease/putative transposase, partial [Gammaproteobacteria bacterium]|nr:Rpn family recombination-promoting nuclease/putative transposase [Gammaproteobacteria bacterium]
MSRPTFADPKTDFIFKRIFGSEPHKHLLIKLLNALLELEEGQLIQDISYLSNEEKIPRDEMKLSIVDVRCIDEQEIQYVVEMQLFNVAGFEVRVIYNASKSFTQQLKTAGDYHELKGVVGVTICDFCLWPDKPEPGAFTLPMGGAHKGTTVPMLSRWRMHEQHSGLPGLAQMQYVFLELPKYTAGAHPTDLVNKWALFFRDAENFDMIPPELDEDPLREAFEFARIVELSDAEYAFYEGQKMKEQDNRGMLVKAREEGEEGGRRQEKEARVAAERR